MKYLFYNPETLVIRAMSTDPNSMELPYIECEKSYHGFENIKLKKEGSDIVMVVKKGTFDKNSK